MTEKTTRRTRKPATARRKPLTTRRRAAAARPTPDHRQISERAYFIHLDEGGGNELEHWLRAERELSAA